MWTPDAVPSAALAGVLVSPPSAQVAKAVITSSAPPRRRANFQRSSMNLPPSRGDRNRRFWGARRARGGAAAVRIADLPSGEAFMQRPPFDVRIERADL